jgi:hypothetical protein
MTAVLSKRIATRLVREASASLVPGAAVVQDLRSREPALERVARPEIQRAMEDLGQRVAGASVQIGSPLLEARTVPKGEEEVRIDSIIAASRLESWKIQQLKPMFERQWQRAARMTVDALERHDIQTSMRDKIASDILLNGGNRIGLVDIAGDTRRALLKVIQTGRELGLNPRKTALLIEHFVPAGRFTLAGKQYRSQMIARTETLSAVREASLMTYDFSRTVEQVMAFDGEEFDETCASRNGEVFSIEAAFLENGNVHPNCVLCWGPA